MTSILQKRDQIRKHISDYIDANNVACKTTLFKNEYFTSLSFERSEIESDRITYLFPRMKKSPTSDDIAKSIINRFFVENKTLSFKPENVINNTELYHTKLLSSVMAVSTLNKDIRNIEKRIKFNMKEFLKIFERGGDTREMSDNENLIYDGFKCVLLGSINSENIVNLPSLYFIAVRMGNEKGKAIMREELGVYKQEKITNLLPVIKDVVKKPKNQSK